MNRLLNFGLLIAFQFYYLECPLNNSMFLFQAEFEIFSKTESLLQNLTHPIILLGLFKQIELLIDAFYQKFNKKSKQYSRFFVYFGFIFFLIGILGLNYKIVAYATSLMIF